MQKIKHFFYKYSVYFFYLFVFVFIFLFVKYYMNEDTSYFKVNTDTINLCIGDNYDLSANVRSSFDTTISWKSEDENIVRIVNNKLVAVGSGFTKITSTYNDIPYEIDIKISEKNESISSIVLNSTNINLTVGKTFNLTPSFIYEGNSSKNVTYESSNSKVATINKNGVINGLKPGKAIITVSKDDMKTTAIVNVYEEKNIIDLDSIEISSDKTTIYKDEYINLKTNIKPINATNQKITWSSSNNNIATVSNGIVKGINPGTATITASCNGKSNSISIIVKDVDINVESISLNKSSISLNVGDTDTLTATINPSNATNKSIIWTSSNNNIATVNNGVIKGIKAGNATITAISNNKKATVNITVNNVEANEIYLDNTELTLNIGAQSTIVATINPSNTTNKNITWSSSNTSVVTISNGVIKGINAGTATITATTSNNKKAYINVTVKKQTSSYVEVTSLTLDKNSLSLYIGSKNTVIATVNPSNATDKTVTWSSSDNNIATVSNGVIKGINAGTATITATCGDKKAYVNITVNTPEVTTIPVTSISLSRTSLTLEVGIAASIFTTVYPSNATYQNITWTSSNPNVASVNNGIIKGLSPGTSIITAYCEGKTASLEFTVLAPTSKNIEVSSITLNKTSGTTYLNKHSTITLTATISPSDATNKNIIWSSSNTNVATVSNGIITPKSIGTTTITAKAGSKSATYTLIVKKNIVFIVGASNMTRMKRDVTEYTSSKGYKYLVSDKTLNFIELGGSGIPWQYKFEGPNTKAPQGYGMYQVNNIISEYSNMKKYVNFYLYFHLSGNTIKTMNCDDITASNTLMLEYAEGYFKAATVIKNQGYNIKNYVVSMQPLNAAQAKNDISVTNDNPNACLANYRSNKKYQKFNLKFKAIIEKNYSSILTFIPLFPQIVSVTSENVEYKFKITYNTEDGIHWVPETTRTYTKMLLDYTGEL